MPGCRGKSWSPSRAPTATSSSPSWEFKPRGQSGKMVSDLLPNLADMADEMCFIHSMTGKSNTHGPAESQMGTGFTLDGFPEHGRLGDLRSWAARIRTYRHSWPSPTRAACPRTVPRHWNSAFLPAVLPRHERSAPIVPSPTSPVRPSISAEATRPPVTSCVGSMTDHLERNPGDTDLVRPDLILRAGGPHAALRGRSCPTCPASRPRRARCTALTTRNVEQGRLRPELHPRPAAAGEGECASCSSSTVRLRDGRGRRQLGRSQDGSSDQYAVHGPILDQPVAGLLKDLKARGLLARTRSWRS